MLSGAAAHLGMMRKRGRKITLTVNLSGHAFNDPQLSAFLKSMLAEYQLDPKRIIFEITETAAVSDMSAAFKTPCHNPMPPLSSFFTLFLVTSVSEDSKRRPSGNC